MTETITSPVARENQLRQLTADSLRRMATANNLASVPTAKAIEEDIDVRLSLIGDILRAEYPGKDPTQCACRGALPYLGVIHSTDGPCLERVFVENEMAAYAETIEAVAPGGEPQVMYFQLRGDKAKTASGRYIVERVLPDVIEHFLAKNADYGDQHRYGLGPKAEFVGIHRKIGKLEAALWKGQQMNGEDAETMLKELIGQCLITLDLLNGNWTPVRPSAEEA